MANSLLCISHSILFLCFCELKLNLWCWLTLVRISQSLCANYCIQKINMCIRRKNNRSICVELKDYNDWKSSFQKKSLTQMYNLYIYGMWTNPSIRGMSCSLWRKQNKIEQKTFAETIQHCLTLQWFFVSRTKPNWKDKQQSVSFLGLMLIASNDHLANMLKSSNWAFCILFKNETEISKTIEFNHITSHNIIASYYFLLYFLHPCRSKRIE